MTRVQVVLRIIVIALFVQLTALPANADFGSSASLKVTLSPDKVSVGDTVTVTANLELGPDKYVYPANSTAGYATKLELKSKSFEPVGDLTSSKVKIKHDEVLGDYEILVGKVVFKQQFKVLKKTDSLKATLIYQVCTNLNCLPIANSDFELPIKVSEALVKPKSAPKATEAPTAQTKTFTKSSPEFYDLTIDPFAQSVESGATIALKVTLKFANKELYTYPHDGENGLATSIWLDDASKKHFEITSIESPSKVHEKEDEFSGTVRYIKETAVWTVKIKAIGDAGNAPLKLAFDTQACDAATCRRIAFEKKWTVSIAKSQKTEMTQQNAKQALDQSELFQLLKRVAKQQEQQATVLKSIQEQLPKPKKGKAFDEVVPYFHHYDEAVEAAKKSGKNLFVVFTGHYCTNCRRMEGSTLIAPAVVKLLEGFECVVLHVDNVSDPEEIQNRDIQERLGGTGPIPAYFIVQLEKQKDKSVKENVLRRHTGVASVEEFSAFLVSGKPQQELNWLSFIGTCIFLGLLTLFMPCTYPMIPITLSLFSKGGQVSRAQAVTRSGIYAAGIIFSYTAIGGIVQLISGAQGQQQIQDFANNGFVNLIIGGLFIYFAFSFFGYYEIAMPAFLRKLMQFGQPSQDDSGAVPGWSLFLMGVFFMLTSYSCGAPFVLAVFEQAASAPSKLSVVIALFVFSCTIALPFMLLALVPSALQSMPRAGGWFTTFKVTLGFFELAFAMKFLSTVDISFGIGFLTRPVFLGIWIVVLILLGLYLLGVFMFPHDAKQERVSMGRFIAALLVFVAAVYLTSWFAGQKLESNLDALLPPHPYPTLDKS